MNDVLDQIGSSRLVAVIKIEQAEAAVPLARALLLGGIRNIEITFRTLAAGEAIRRIAGEVPGALLGAGTVLSVKQAEAALSAGARFIVSPGFSSSIVEWGRANSTLVLPGVATPTEIMRALDYRLSVLKFFPAEELGGTRMLKALAGPFSEVKLIPTGGINLSNITPYLQLPNVLAIGGSWMAPPSLIAAGNFEEITRLAAEASAQVQLIRDPGG